jgi:hypothetical protein
MAIQVFQVEQSSFQVECAMMAFLQTIAATRLTPHLKT